MVLLVAAVALLGRLGVVAMTARPAVVANGSRECDDAAVAAQRPGPRDDDKRPRGEPDYRMSLAAERTFLAYARTALALLAGGVACVGALPDAGQLALRRVLGALLVTLGLFVSVQARRRWQAVDRAMRSGEPLPVGVLGAPVTAGLVVAALLALVLVVLL